jgi:uncharacterized protein with PIN domain
VDLEEHTLESLGDRCEVCGARLTDREKEAVLETGGPSLCSIHSAELEPALEDELDDE